MAKAQKLKAKTLPSPLIKNYTAVKGTRFLIVGFAAVILVGTVFLRLPQASAADQLTWFEAMFTATSATTVTGLILFPTAETFSRFGEIIILILIQIGGIGFVTLSVLLLRMIGRSVSLGERRLVRSLLGASWLRGSVTQLTAAVVIVVLSIEFLGAIPLFFEWREALGVGEAAYYAIFHSISSFCNAGFDLFAGTADPLVVATRKSIPSILTLTALITLGTMGIAATFDLLNYPRRRRMSLHTKLILPFMLAITVIGVGVFLIEHVANGGLLTLEQGLSSFFTVVSARTAGITLVDITDLGPASQLFIAVSMFVGGAPASMGGGVGLTTIAVMLLAFFNMARGNPDVRAYGRTIPTETIYKALAILGVASILVISVTTAVIIVERGEIFPLMFEVISAFSNTGYSLGVTAALEPLSKALIMLAMFLGRLGPLTLVVALAEGIRYTQLRFPEERIIIG